MKAWSAARYLITKDEHKESRRALRVRNRAVIAGYLLTHPCVDCGLTDRRILTFDHVRGEKKGNVSEMIRLGWGLKTIFEEIAKCEVRCFNCHMRKDAPRSGISAAYSELKSGAVLPVSRQ